MQYFPGYTRFDRTLRWSQSTYVDDDMFLSSLQICFSRNEVGQSRKAPPQTTMSVRDFGVLHLKALSKSCAIRLNCFESCKGCTSGNGYGSNVSNDVPSGKTAFDEVSEEKDGFSC